MVSFKDSDVSCPSRYASELLAGLAKVGWPHRTRLPFKQDGAKEHSARRHPEHAKASLQLHFLSLHGFSVHLSKTWLMRNLKRRSKPTKCQNSCLRQFGHQACKPCCLAGRRPGATWSSSFAWDCSACTLYTLAVQADAEPPASLDLKRFTMPLCSTGRYGPRTPGSNAQRFP